MSRRTFDILISCRPAAHSSTNPNLAIKSFQSGLQVDIWSTLEQISNKCSGKCPGRRAQICSRAAIFAVISIFEVIYSKYWNWCGKGLQTKVCSDGTSSNGNVELEEIFSKALCIASLNGKEYHDLTSELLVKLTFAPKYFHWLNSLRFWGNPIRVSRMEREEEQEAKSTSETITTRERDFLHDHFERKRRKNNLRQSRWAEGRGTILIFSLRICNH